MAAPAAGFESFPTPLAVADHARFFVSWLRRIAPDTHVDQANGGASAARPSGVAAPEERWCRRVSNGVMTDLWLPVSRLQSLAGSRSGRSAVLQIGDGDTASHSDHMVFIPVPLPGLPLAVETHAKQRFMSNGFFSFNIWKHARANLWASALIATTPLVLAFLRS